MLPPQFSVLFVGRGLAPAAILGFICRVDATRRGGVILNGRLRHVKDLKIPRKARNDNREGTDALPYVHLRLTSTGYDVMKFTDRSMLSLLFL